MDTNALYKHLLEVADQITEDWLQERNSTPGSFYSAQSNDDVDALLRKQHRQTIQLMISSLKPIETDYQSRLDDWAQTVAKSRVDNEIEGHVVIKFLQKTRRIFWQYINRYINATEDIPSVLVSNWSETVNSGFDLMISRFLEYYHEFTERRLSEHQELIKLLEIPLIKLYNQTSILPVIGVINSDRGMSLLNEVPMKCSETRVEKLIMDLSGVSQIEEAVAHQLTQLIEVLNLMGISCYISGISPEVAKNTLSFGEEFHRIPKISSIQEIWHKLMAE